ncbi:MAG: hypothetical protein U9O64_02530 [Campylobacterota bacterium]|nr:hypothetical protein [Campylobacterota bacterium]
MLRCMIVLTGIAVLLGCTSKEEIELMKAYKEKIKYHKALQKTEKIQLYENNMTKVMVTATYLYHLVPDKNDTRDESFVVGIHLEDDVSDDSGYKLLLNGKEAKEIEALKRDDVRLKELSFISKWGEYYLFTFPHIGTKKIRLLFESERYGKAELHFAKVAKYSLTKEAF